jgi:hypothetical protein
MYGNLGPYYGAVALGKGVSVPSPFEEVARGYFLYDDDFAKSYVEGTTPPPVDTDSGEEAGIPSPTQSSSTPTSKLGGTSLLGKALDYVEDRITNYMAFPEAVNPLTGTVRATGVSRAISGMMPGFFGPLMEAGYKANMANLSRIAGMSQVNKDYSTGLLGGQLVGVEPTADTLGGKIASAFGFNVDGYTLSGNIGGFTNVDQDAFEDAVITSLLANRPNAYGPGRAVAMGLDPQVTYSQTELMQEVATEYGRQQGIAFDPFSPSSQYAFGGPYAPFVDPGAGRPDPTRPGGIVGRKDQDGNWRGVTSGTYTSTFGLPGMTDFAFYNMGPGYSAADMRNLEGTGGTDFSGIDPTGTGGAFTGDPVGMADEYEDDNYAGSGAFGGGYGPSFDDSSLGKGDGGGDGFGGGDYGGGQEARGVAKGGRIGYATGTPKVTQGFINKDPDSVTDEQSIADNRYTSVPEGTMIMNQPSNDKYEKQLDKLVAEAKRNVKLSNKRPKMVEVALSDGERSIHPEYVAYIEKKKGKGYLEKLNNQGKAEVSRRQAKYGEKIGAANGGMLQDDPTLSSKGFLNQGMELQDVGEDIPMIDYLPVSDELLKSISKFANKKPKRGEIKDFIKGLSPEDKLTVLFLTETKSTTDPLESMQAIGEVVQNRIDSNYFDFKKLNTLDDVLLDQTAKGAFQFSGLEPTVFFNRAKEVKAGLASDGLSRAAAAAQNVLNPETEGNRILSRDTVFYTRKDASNQWMRNSKNLQYSSELGDHEFYSIFKTP